MEDSMIDYLDALTMLNEAVALSFDGLWFTLGIGFGLLLGEVIRKFEE